MDFRDTPHVNSGPKRYMLPSYHYSNLAGTLIFWLAWVACFVVGKAYRSEMRWGTLIAAPMALTSLLFRDHSHPS